eukprot:gene8509-9422_t
MSAESQNEMIALLADEVRQNVIMDIKQAGMFSFSADTTPDLSKFDQMAVVCRITGADGLVKERLLAIKHVTSKTGAETAEDIIHVLNSSSLNTDELCFQSYDFAASMSGRYNGAQQKFQEKLNQIVPYIPCQAHRSNTVLEHSCSCSVVKDMFKMLVELYVFFKSSTKRRKAKKRKVCYGNISRNGAQTDNVVFDEGAASSVGKGGAPWYASSNRRYYPSPPNAHESQQDDDEAESNRPPALAPEQPPNAQHWVPGLAIKN